MTRRMKFLPYAREPFGRYADITVCGLKTTATLFGTYEDT
jgi:hypothetical protein